jgi:hypothetical protein
MRGYSDDTDLVCEEWKKAGSHMKERFCYTREEYDKVRFNHRETMRKVIERGTPRGGG